MDTQKILKKLPRYLLKLLVITAIYFLSGKLGLKLAFLNSSASAFWPPTGLSIALLLLFGYEILPAIFLGAYFVNVTTTSLIASSFFIALGNTLEAFLAVFLIRKYTNGIRVFESSKGVLAYLAIASVSTLLSATIGVTALTFFSLNPLSNYGHVWFTWWIGDLVSALKFAPLILVWSTPFSFKSYTKAKIIELGVMTFLLILFFLLAFQSESFGLENRAPLVLIIPLLIWIAFRFDKRTALTITFLLSLAILFFTLQGKGPFAAQSPNDTLLFFEAFIGTIAFITVLTSSVVEEHNKFEKSISYQNLQLSKQSRQTQKAAKEEHLLREKLQKTYDRLKTLDNLKLQFLTNTSHELKTPITPILIQTELLLKEDFGKLSNKQKKSIQMILRNVKNLDTLITSVLDASKIQSKAMKLYPLKTSLEKVLEQSVENFKPLITKKNIQLKTKISPLPKFFFDPVRIREVFNNLLDNAIKFSSKREGKIEIFIENKKTFALIKIKDNGIGISQQNLRKLFLPFSQVKPSYQRKEKGTGLGLAICKGIVEQHGGKLKVESSPGKGSLFYFTLPFKKTLNREGAKN